MQKEIGTLIILGMLGGMVFLTIHGNSNNVYAEKCEDIKHEGDDALKWGAEKHGDNEASESKFNKMWEGSATICEVSKCYDHVQCEGEISEGEWKEFKESIVYVGTTEDVQDCLDHRFKLPDHGDKELQAYEIKDCALNNY